jgi:Uma2 family endonuclease
MLAPEKTLVSADEFWMIVQLPENRDKHLELVDGEIVEMAGGTGGPHGEVGGRIIWWIGNVAIPNNLGRVTSSETCYRLYENPYGKDIVRCPDAAFVSMERAPQPFEEGYIPYAPDLAVEVISPGNDADEMQRKVLDYLTYGTRLVWLIYPDTHTITVYTNDGAKILREKDMLEGGDVLPGFSVKVADIFPQ